MTDASPLAEWTDRKVREFCSAPSGTTASLGRFAAWLMAELLAAVAEDPSIVGMRQIAVYLKDDTGYYAATALGFPAARLPTPGAEEARP